MRATLSLTLFFQRHLLFLSSFPSWNLIFFLSFLTAPSPFLFFICIPWQEGGYEHVYFLVLTISQAPKEKEPFGHDCSFSRVVFEFGPDYGPFLLEIVQGPAIQEVCKALDRRRPWQIYICVCLITWSQFTSFQELVLIANNISPSQAHFYLQHRFLGPCLG